ncbi:hypothetical protein GCM10023193_55820 [Planotetraspora kaengkrachanensis]|uniref:Uncharacterized protein n=1 Tax=Planotetraspora kaengkrachanensis TaxID=575193 RepID=A0A8J3V5Z2_9ACTN|nr:hypothetical protein Pka01_44670 [Planotetraspora kaengkrachanensis]
MPAEKVPVRAAGKSQSVVSSPAREAPRVRLVPRVCAAFCLACRGAHLLSALVGALALALVLARGFGFGCFAPADFAPVCFAPVCFAPVCFAPVCFAPVCFAPVCFAPADFAPVYFCALVIRRPIFTMYF